MDALIDDVHTEIDEPGLSKWGVVEEIVNRLRAGGMSDISIRAMLIDQKPVQGPPPGWPPSVTPAQAREMLDTYRERFPEVARVAREVFGEEEMASDVAEVQRAFTHEDELRAERLRTGTDEERMRKGFSGRVG